MNETFILTILFMEQQLNNPVKEQSNNTDEHSSQEQTKKGYPEADLGNMLERQSAGFYEITPERSSEELPEYLNHDAEPERDATVQMASGLEEDGSSKASKEHDFTGL
jgi:hypothetical protein